MAETPPVTPEAPPETPPVETPPEPKEEKTVPYERFAQVNGQAKEAEKQLKELRDRLQELEDKDKSELERERGQREKLQEELQQREQRLVTLERGSWVRDAANEAKFIDPADALGRVDLSAVESEADAKKAVKKVAENAKHLIRTEPDRPSIGRVLAGGQTVDPNAPNPADEENEKFLQELKDASQKGWSAAGKSLID